MCTGSHCVGRIAFYAVTHIMVCNPCVSYRCRVRSQHLQRAAGLVGAVIVAVVPVRPLLLRLPARLLLLAATAVAVAMVILRRGGPLPMLLVVPVDLVVGALDLLFGTIVRHLLAVDECCPSLGVVQALEVVVMVAVGHVTLWHHLQVGPDAVVAGAGVVAEVDDTALVGALIGRFDPGEAELVGDVAPHDFHHLAT